MGLIDRTCFVSDGENCQNVSVTVEVHFPDY